MPSISLQLLGANTPNRALTPCCIYGILVNLA
jgi:hypothetical protein